MIALEERDEEDLRRDVRTAVEEELPDLVLQERGFLLDDFPGVGGVDLIIVHPEDRAFRDLAELKWSTDSRRDKIFEAAWDLVKLAIAGREPRIEATADRNRESDGHRADTSERIYQHLIEELRGHVADASTS